VSEQAREVRAAAAEFVATVGADLASQGFPRLPAFVLMALTASESGRMTSAELTEELGVSAAAISGAVRYLTGLGFVRTLTAPGSRRHSYALGDTPWYTTTLTAAERYLPLARMLRQAGERLVDRPAAQERIDELAEFFEFLQRRLPALLVEWDAERAQRSAPSPPRELS
jgi:DNA-binding transcriptional regulator GbsR (MarR family)